MNKKSKLIILCLSILLAAAIGVILWQTGGREETQAPGESTSVSGSENSTQTNQTGLIVPERPEMLDIVAFESLELKADTLKQSVRFDNPPENNCYLVITLSLEDGTVLWKSEELRPGQCVREITMNQTLAEGEYKNAVILYQHWTHDAEKLPLNGAETLVTLNVIQ